MESAHREILTRLRSDIINDVDVNNGIINPLSTEYILREEDVNNIRAGKTKPEQAGILLDILPRCGPYAFDAFHQSLKHQYEWLSDNIDKLLGNSASTRTNGIDCYAGLFNMPPVSPLTVTREKKVHQLKVELQKLQPREYIALHGMKGFGKSCLIASVLKDIKLTKDLFSNKIYWIKFGYENPVDEEILTQLTILYYNVRSPEILPESFTPPQKDVLIQFLKHHFKKADNQNDLLILDDVSDKKIISSFDFECKTLVLTIDIDVLCDKKPKIIEMNDGFSETETLGLFANVLDMSINELPIEAKKIHEECKGMPLLIAMFAAQFEEFKHDMKIRSDRWKYYLDSLKKKDATNRVIREFLEKQEAIFNMCIEQLRPDLRNCYEALAIFNEDVNITPKTLEILWERDIFQVEELMLELCHKSLAAKQWNNDLKTYVYGVHDLLLCHLREKLTQDKLTEMHKSVIEKYYKYCANDLSKLPDDNYIYLYIGYHFEQAKLFDQLSQLYLNFDFIQAKIMCTGLSDLLLDIKKYGKYMIYNQNDDYEAISDMERFLQEQAGIIAEHRHKKCLDIIQIAMNHPYPGYVAQNARYLAMTRQQYLYLFHDKKLDHANMPLSEEISTGICTTSFTDNPNTILIGNSMGKIILWDCERKQQIVFEGHDNSIKKIIVSKQGDYFLSLTNSGVVRLFALCNDMFDHHMHVDSPKQKQRFWHELFGKANDHDDSLIKFSIKNEIILDIAFGHEDKYIVASTDKSTVQIWDRCGNTVMTFNDFHIGPIRNIAFTSQGTLLHIMDESKGATCVYANHENEYRYICAYGLQLHGKKIVFYHHVPKHDDSLMIVTEDKAIYVKWFHASHDQIRNFKKQVRAYVEDDAVTYVCATITYDGEYLIVADSAGFINVWHTDTGYQPIATYKSRVTYLDTYWLEDEGYHIICGNENRMLHRWKLPIQESDALVRKSLFDAVVEPYDEIDTVVKENCANKLVVSRGEETIAESELIKGKILSLQFSSDGERVIFTTDNNIVALFDIKTRKITIILELSQPIQFLKILNVENNDIIICRETDNELRVCQNMKVPLVVKNTDRVVCIHKLNNHVLTITQNGIIRIWNIDSTWCPINQTTIPYLVGAHISSSCISYKKIYLAILIEPHRLMLYTLHENTTVSSIHVQIKYYHLHIFKQKVTHFNISQNEQYIAVGLETGQISIIDIQQKKEIQQLFFHSNPITQLSWAPINVGAPILASLTCDELVWWNIALVNNSNNIKRRSRMGITHSTSTPSFSMNTNSNSQMSSSQSLVTGMSDFKINGDSSASTDTHINDVSKYWMNKISKDPKLPGLLATVELPSTRIAKVCISKDFTKFLTVDIYGSVSIFKLFGYTQ